MITLPDLGLLATEAVKVSLATSTAPDEFGAVETVMADPVEVRGVLVAPGVSSEIADSVRPYADKVAFTIHFPKTWEPSLRGAVVEVRGEKYRVIGDPRRFTAPNIPGPWDRAVPVETVKG